MMSRLGGLGSFATIRLSSNAMQAAALAGFVDKIVDDNCADKLKKAASDLADKMKEMLVRNQSGLAPNGELTIQLKGSTVPLVDSSQLANSITYKMLDEGYADLGASKAGVAKTNRFRAAFVGVMRSGPMKSGGSLLGMQTAVELYTVAKNMVRGYTVKLPSNGVKKKVPSRDFRKEPLSQYKDEYLEMMKGGVSSGLMRAVK